MLGHKFVVKKEQQSLMFLIEQKVGTPAQHKWISKLFSYDLHIEHKQVREIKLQMLFLEDMKKN